MPYPILGAAPYSTPPPPDPQSLGAVLWLRTDDLVLSGSDVLGWNDKTGNGRDCALIGGATAGTLTAAVQNGHPSVDLAGNSGYAGPFGVDLATTGYSIMAIWSRDSGASNDGVFDSSTDTSTNNGAMLIGESTEVASRYGNSGGFAFHNRYVDTSTVVRVNYAGAPTTAPYTLWRGSTLEDSDGGTLGASRVIDFYRIGRLFQDVFLMNGMYLDLAVFPYDITSGPGFALLQSYVASYWAL